MCAPAVSWRRPAETRFPACGLPGCTSPTTTPCSASTRRTETGCGGSIKISEHEPILQRHRQLMATVPAKKLYRRRSAIVEPVFGLLKEWHGARRFLLRGRSHRSVRMAPAGHRVQSQEPPRGVQVRGQPSVAPWGRSAAPAGALPDRRTPPSPTPSPALSPFCSYHPPSDYIPHPTHHAPYQYNETASLMGGVCWSALAIHRTFTYPCRPVKGEGVMQRSLTYMGGQAFRGNHQGLAKAT